jgi:hypothetical protein
LIHVFVFDRSERFFAYFCTEAQFELGSFIILFTGFLAEILSFVIYSSEDVLDLGFEAVKITEHVSHDDFHVEEGFAATGEVRRLF